MAVGDSIKRSPLFIAILINFVTLACLQIPVLAADHSQQHTPPIFKSSSSGVSLAIFHARANDLETFTLVGMDPRPIRAFRLQAPERGVLDFAVPYTLRPYTIPTPQSTVIDRIRIAPRNDGTRVVFDLKQSSTNWMYSSQGSDKFLVQFPSAHVSSSAAVDAPPSPPIVRADRLEPRPSKPNIIAPPTFAKYSPPAPPLVFPPERKSVTAVVRKGLLLDRLYLEFSKDARPISNLTLSNGSENDYQVRTIVEEVLSMGKRPEKRIRTKSVIASPRQFSLPTGEDRAVRIISTVRATDSERYFRVSFIPFNPGQPNDQTLEVFVGVGALVTILPAHPEVSWDWSSSSTSLTLNNLGNVTLSFTGGQFTSSTGANAPLPELRVYPGSSASMSIPSPRGTATFQMRALDKFEPIIIAVPK